MSNLSMLEVNVARLWSIVRGSPVMSGLKKTAVELSQAGAQRINFSINVADIGNPKIIKALELQGIESIKVIQEYFQPLLNTPEKMALLLKRIAAGVKEGKDYTCYRLLDFDSGFKVERSGSEIIVSRAGPF